ncbi:WecB/TagA/CpsF family glycosyltransferase [Clostridium sporogenes]|uniref:WecB/TagA/CpsF family glycosyltransferase n=1 Tax=Clostridium sporogenes TaxID=1509 RepID=UPI0013D52357|nr:WecB/TagA/CpsF family glycosyltransferase [Clostridium sporogenes]NFD95905.1 WecB/TagA/CpsF family glycosyltransferase [Clostridium sporogenes]NFE45041.1 WecB/TagA/CpsF family glycosyltransferase [Clostridium sporogenes]NFF18021.1 WecB/TagA/CpsF family glycosyltransferase [Clostridium sporogenes]NFF73516.1 WecB/TagA/CpsF family glycosyltransferase [Clostridium sporogenes]NFF96405.1 WecB/TagA/CpsF family glycosyltransferase [Clostridium sporogenes]
MKTVKMFDCNVAALTMEETIQEIECYIKERKPVQHVVINAGKVVLMENNEELKTVIQKCPLINADGQSIVWASKILAKPLPERVTGIDLMENLVCLSNEKGYRIYFFGAKEHIVKKVIEKYKDKYPNLQIAGYRNGYFSEKDNKDIVEDMKKSKADILFVAFSSPKKEFWLYNNMDKIDIPFCMGVGGSFDVVAGKTKRSPKWMQKIGLEWFYRFMQEPRRMWKRYLVGNFKFIKIVIEEKMKRKNKF